MNFTVIDMWLNYCSKLTFGCSSLAAFVSRASQRAQLGELQRAFAVITASATGRNQLKKVLLRHEAPWKSPTT